MKSSFMNEIILKINSNLSIQILKHYLKSNNKTTIRLHIYSKNSKAFKTWVTSMLKNIKRLLAMTEMTVEV